MRLPWPDAAQDRWLVLGQRFRALRGAAELATRTGGWKTASTSSRCLFFLLGLAAAAMILGSVLMVPGRFAIGGLVMIGLAEWSIAHRRVVRSGLEEALTLAGLGCIAGQLLLWLSLKEGWAIAAVLGMAPLLAGARLRNPLFTTLGAAVLTAALATLPAWRSGGAGELVACAASSGVALLALAAGARRFLRPAHDAMLDGLVIALPCVAWAWATAAAPGPLRAADVVAGTARAGSWLPVLLPGAFAILCLATGVRRRRHAPVLAALLCIACIAHALRALTGLGLHWHLLLWGSLALGASVALDRWLRTPRAGITSADVDDPGSPLELLQVAGAAVAAPRLEAPGAAAGFEGGGGAAGGAGATGRF